MSEEIIKALNLEPHAEGGYFRRTYTAQPTININGKKRAIGSAIYYYLASDDFSAWHRLGSDELWHFYSGCDITLHYIDPQGEINSINLGDPENNQSAVPQFLIPAHTWFAAEVNAENTYSLLGCTCFPEFSYEEFELADRDELIKIYPDHAEIITRLTRK